MRRISFAWLLLICCNVFSQTWLNKINDEYYKSTLIHSLKVGDVMPDIPLGLVYNASKLEGKNKFSDFKGKLIILDFWASHCASCIAGFPKMKKLQDQFEDKIQIILVNIGETIESTEKRKGKDFLNRLQGLPSIFVDSLGKIPALWKLFPGRALGDHVWIDRDSKIILRGSSYNSYAEKIDDALNGRHFFAMNSRSVTPLYDITIPYHTLIGDFKSTYLKFGSFITPFNNEYDPYGGFATNIIDSAAATKRFTWINIDIAKLYSGFVYEDVFSQLKEKTMYMPGGLYSNIRNLSYWILPKDIFRYTIPYSLPVPQYNIKETDIIKSLVCYEQIVPINLPEEERKKIMAEEIGRYLANLYGTQIKWEKLKIPCYILVRTSNVDKLSSRHRSSKEEIIIKNGKSMSNYVKTPFAVIGDCIGAGTALQRLLEKNRQGKKYFLLLNETGFDKRKEIDIVLPGKEDLKAIADLRDALKSYDLDIIEAIRELPFLVVTDNSGK